TQLQGTTHFQEASAVPHDRKKPGVAFWATVVVVVALVAYPLSFGPACWISSRVQPSGNVVSVIYKPVILAWLRGPPPVEQVLNHLVFWGMARTTLQIGRAS